MKWVTHEVVTGAAVFSLTGDVLASLYSMAGAIVPDKIEGGPLRRIRLKLFGGHRGWSHWPMAYLLAALLFSQADELAPLGPALGEIKRVGFFLAVGALFHIGEDALCGKVPFILPTQKIGVKLFKVGTVMEYVVAILLVALFYALGAEGNVTLLKLTM